MAITFLECNLIETHYSYKWDSAHQRVNIYEVIMEDDEDSRHVDPVDVLNYTSDTRLGGADHRGFNTQWRWGAGSEHTDPTSVLIAADVRPRGVKENRRIWRLTLTFESYASFQQSQQQGDSFHQGSLLPWQQSAKWSGGFFHVEEEASVDVNGKRVANSADQPYEGQVIDKAFDTLVVEFNTETIDYDLRSKMVNTVNDAEHWGFPVKALKLKDWAYDIRYHGRDGTDATKLKPWVYNRIEFHVKNDAVGWMIKLVNWGSAFKAQEAEPEHTYKVIEMPTESGALIPYTNLVLKMDGSGPEDPQPANTNNHMNEFEFFKPSDFTTLPTEIQGGPPAAAP